MAKNELWFYKGVRYAKDGRYACYCPTPAKKRTVLLQNAVVTLSRNNGTNDVLLTPWNMRTREIAVRIGNGWAGNAEQALNFINSNYLIVHDMQTGYYYNYYIDYIEPIQQLKEYPAPPHVKPEEISLNLYNVGDNEQTYRVGISLDYWQTFFFAMHTNIDGPQDRPQYCAPHSTLSDTINVVDTPAFEFANITRTNSSRIIQRLYGASVTGLENIGRGEANLSQIQLIGIQRPQISRALLGGTSWRIVARVQPKSDPSIFFNQSGQQAYWIFFGYPFSSLNPSALTLTQLGNLGKALADTGTYKDLVLPPDWQENNLGLGGGVGIRDINILEYYLMPSPLVENIMLTPGTVNGSITVRYGGTSSNPSTISVDTYYLPINSTLPGYTFRTGINYPTANSPAELATIGGNINRMPLFTGVYATHNVKGYKTTPVRTGMTATQPIIIRFIYTQQAAKITLSTTFGEIEITQDLQLKQFFYAAETNKEKSENGALNVIARILGFAGTAAATYQDFSKGNIVGGVQGAMQIVNNAASDIESSIINKNNPSKEYAKKGGLPQSLLNLTSPLYMEFFTNNLDYSANCQAELDEFGYRVSCLVTSITATALLDNAASTNALGMAYAYFEMGALIRDMQQEPAEVLERRFREGVTFWYE